MNVLKLFRLIAVFVLLFAAVTPVVSSNILERSEANLQELRRQSKVMYNASADEIKKRQKDDLAHPYYAMVDWLLWKTKTSYDETETQKFTNLTNFLLNHGGHWGWSKTQSMTEAELTQFKHLASRYYSVNDQASVVESQPHFSTLQDCKQTVQIHTLSDNLIYTYNPEIERWVVMEKLTEDRAKDWHQYASSQMQEMPRNGRAKDDDGKYIKDYYQFVPDNSGMDYFKLSIRNRFKIGLNPMDSDTTNDMWVAYISNKKPTEDSLKKEIQPENVEMVTTVRAQDDLNVYSPMGISRTVEAAKAMVANPRKQQDRITHSMYLHGLAARMAKRRYKKLSYMWTAPVRSMRLLFAKYLHPEVMTGSVAISIELYGPDLKKRWNELRKKWEKVPEEKRKIKFLTPGNLNHPSWQKDFEFGLGKSSDEEISLSDIPQYVYIKIEDLMRSIL